jgi:hypothetical protein
MIDQDIGRPAASVETREAGPFYFERPPGTGMGHIQREGMGVRGRAA